jgi:hypothetical protein
MLQCPVALAEGGSLETPVGIIGNNDNASPMLTNVPHNRCGHNPYNLRGYEKPRFHAKRPLLLEKAADSLAIGTQYSKSANRQLLKIFNLLNPSNRQKRSERRESLNLVLGRVLHYTDIATLEVGAPKADGSFYYASVEEIARDTQIHHQRALRALHDAEKAGYVKLTAFSAQDATTKQYFYRIETKPRLFLDLGIKYNVIERARAYAFKQHAKTGSGLNLIQNITQLSKYLQNVRKGVLRRSSSKPGSQSAASRQTIERLEVERRSREEKARIEKYQQLHARYPDRSTKELYEEVYGRPLLLNTS